MQPRNRREFLADVGRGMLVAGLGAAAGSQLELGPAWADNGPARLDFGALEPLAAQLQETPVAKLLPVLMEKMQGGTELRTLVAAAALANARTFGGHDYDGYHTFMALGPAYHMALESPAERRPLPVLKVLHRNARFIQHCGGRAHEALHALETAAPPAGETPVRDATRKADQPAAERTFAALTRQSLDDAY